MRTISERTQFAFKDLAPLMAGLAMLVVGFAAITTLPDWVTCWRTVAVYLAYFPYMSMRRTTVLERRRRRLGCSERHCSAMRHSSDRRCEWSSRSAGQRRPMRP
ncbi:hypothetical protein [Mycolicibacterium cosmeticum]|uniref:hypothetical protein n=1 Tax=Mycolicibacterium cosmeticum TaxID=258533 RepID=UPI003204A942